MPCGPYEAEFTLYHLSVSAIGLQSIREWKAHLRAMREVKKLVQAHFSKLLANGTNASRRDFMEAIKVAVRKVRESRSKLSPWRYFTRKPANKIYQQPGTQKVIRLLGPSGNLAAALVEWNRILVQEGINDISAIRSGNYRLPARPRIPRPVRPF